MAIVIRKVGKEDRAQVSLPKMLFQPGYARDRELADNSYGDDAVLQGDPKRDRLDGLGGPETIWIDGVPRDRATGLSAVNMGGNGPSPWLPTDIGSLNLADDEANFSNERLDVDLDAMFDHPMNTAVVDTRQWPVPGNGQPARQNQIGPNGRSYSDGRYAPTGGFRGIDPKTKKPRVHLGIDLPAPIGEPVRSADDGVVYGQGTAKGFGKYTAIRHSDGRISIYAHLNDYSPMPAGTKVVQGRKLVMSVSREMLREREVISISSYGKIEEARPSEKCPRERFLSTPGLGSVRKRWLTDRFIGVLLAAVILLQCPAPSLAVDVDRKIVSYYSPTDLVVLKKEKSVEIFESVDYIAVEHRIYSAYSMDIWKLVEIRYEDGTGISIEGPAGSLFYLEDGDNYWGYRSDNENLDIFIIDSGAWMTAQDSVKTLGQVDYGYVAFLARPERMVAYDCTFDATRFDDRKAVALASRPFSRSQTDDDHLIYGEVAKFLSVHGVDIAADHCRENPAYLRDAAKAFGKSAG